jgi:hypothetical protein
MTPVVVTTVAGRSRRLPVTIAGRSRRLPVTTIAGDDGRWWVMSVVRGGARR